MQHKRCKANSANQWANLHTMRSTWPTVKIKKKQIISILQWINFKTFEDASARHKALSTSFWSLGNRLAKQQCQRFKGHCLPFGYLGTPRGVVHHPRGVSRSVPVPVCKQRRWGKLGAQLPLRGQLLEHSCSAQHHRWSNHLNTQHLGMRGCCPLAETLRLYWFKT